VLAPVPLQPTLGSTTLALSHLGRLERVLLWAACEAEDTHVGGNALAERPRLLRHVLEVGHTVAERRFVCGLVGQGKVQVVEPEATDKEDEETNYLQCEVICQWHTDMRVNQVSTDYAHVARALPRSTSCLVILGCHKQRWHSHDDAANSKSKRDHLHASKHETGAANEGCAANKATLTQQLPIL
jgi:hypothetical protein